MVLLSFLISTYIYTHTHVYIADIIVPWRPDVSGIKISIFFIPWAACPSFVSLEISHDGRTVIPTSPPLVTCSLAIIKLQLLRPEVVSSVTLRLHRPRDSMTIGLQQVCLRGQRAFGEVGEGPSALLPSEDTMSTCRFGQTFMRILKGLAMSACR